jgi:hypothetical protein
MNKSGSIMIQSWLGSILRILDNSLTKADSSSISVICFTRNIFNYILKKMKENLQKLYKNMAEYDIITLG